MNRLIAENSDVGDSLDLVYKLHALNTIQNNLSTLTMSGVISLDNAKLVCSTIKYALNQLIASSLDS